MLEDISPLLDYFLYRPQYPNFDRQFNSGEWVEVIDHLMAAGYDFKSEQFNDDGYLFRGMGSGFLDALQEQKFGHCPSPSETNRAEQIMQIYFVTHELSDAITASCLYDMHQDNAVLVFKSSLFNQSLHQGEAAVLNVGDMGVIFRYPFLTQHLTLSDVEYIFVNEAIVETIKECLPAITHRIMSIPVGKQCDVLIEAQKQLASHEIFAANPQETLRYPRLRKYRKSCGAGFMKF